MHDELIERRLRSALAEEAGSLPFTITAAELERRIALRRRSFAGRRLALLLAAGIGLGLVGIGGALRGLVDEPRPTPLPTPPVAVVESDSPLPTGPAELPTLNDLVGLDPGGVVIAQAHDPIRPPGVNVVTGLPGPVVDLGALDSTSPDYLLTAACLDSTALRFEIGPKSGLEAPDESVIPCDGRLHDARIQLHFPQHLSFSADEGARWRLLVRGPRQIARDDPGAPLQPGADEEELGRIDGEVVDTEIAWGDSGLAIEEVTGLVLRTEYHVQVACPAGTPFRLLFGDRLDLDEFDTDTDGELFIASETQVACNGNARGVRISIPEQLGYHLYVAAPLGTPFDMLISSAPPPIELIRALPGWRLASGIGPSLSFQDSSGAFTGPRVDDGGKVLIAFACTGERPIEISVEVGPKIGDRQESFTAKCTPDGATTTQTFEIAAPYVDVSFAAPAMSWTALSILIPDRETLP